VLLAAKVTAANMLLGPVSCLLLVLLATVTNVPGWNNV
jgi:hypothetical protein